MRRKVWIFVATALDVLIDCMKAEALDTVFGIPGGLLYPFFDRVEQDPSLSLVVARHESGAAFMADGYARVRGLPAVAAATAGPGATNLLTGTGVAMSDGVPMIILTGQASRAHFGRGASQESWPEDIDIVRMFQPVTKYSSMVFSPDHIGRQFRRALRCALSGRPGPVHLNIPVDIWHQQVEDGAWNPAGYRSNSAAYDPAQVRTAVNALRKSEFPLMLVGAGAASPAARRGVVQLAEFLGSPVVTTPRGKGVLPEDHPLSLGVFGFAGHPSAKEAVLDGPHDVLITIGASLNETTTLTWHSDVVGTKKLIQIDIDAERIGRNYPVDIPVVGASESILPALLDGLQKTGRSSRVQNIISKKSICDQELRESERMPLTPQRWRAEMTQALPPDCVIFSDIGGHMLFNIHHLEIVQDQRFILNLGFGSMGHGTAAPIGACLAANGLPVVAIIGDACFSMLGMELITAVEYEIPVVWIVENNQMHGVTWHASKKLSGGRPMESIVNRKRLNAAEIAKAMGLAVWKVEKPGQMAMALEGALSGGVPSLIEVDTDPSVSPPVGDRVESVAGFKR